MARQDIPDSELLGIQLYKYPLGSGGGYNYIPIFVMNLSKPYADYYKPDDYYHIGDMGHIHYSDYNLTALMWAWQRKKGENFNSGVFGNYEDNKLTINSSEDATDYTIDLYGKINNSYIGGVSGRHSTDIGYNFGFQMYITAMRGSDGKVFATVCSGKPFKSNSEIYAINFPSVGAKGSVAGEAFTGNYSEECTANSKKNEDVQNLISGLKPWNPDDPYENVGDEPDDPGQGDFDYSSDDVPIPDLPETDVTESGLVSLFAPNDDQLQRLAKFLWSDTFSLDSFKKILNNPMDCILGLSKLPVHLPHGTSKEITVGNVVSTVSCDTCKQYLKLNCGTFTFSRSKFTGGYLDNAPYTRCYLYLPFIGTQEINIDEFMGATMGIEYHIDVLTGAMFCFVTRNSKLLLTYAGNCAENIPLSSNDFTSTISSMLSMATVGAGAIATIATAGAAAPTTAGMASEALGARTASSLVGAGAQGASAVMNSKPNVAHSGSLGGGAGAMGQLYPYLIFIAPRPDIPTNQNSYTGFPSNKIEKIGNLKGFNVIEAVNLKVEGANDNEMSEIEAILKGGVII